MESSRDDNKLKELELFKTGAQDLANTRILEALLFASDHPLTAQEIAAVLPDGKAELVGALVKELNQDYEQQKRAIQIREIAGGYQLYTRPEYATWLNALFARTRTQRLSKAGLEALAIIAYKQPTSRAEIERIRGVQTDSVMRTLLERGLITIVGREEGPGRPLLYGTTDKFLQYFGLKSLDDLPGVEELEAIIGNKSAGLNKTERSNATGSMVFHSGLSEGLTPSPEPISLPSEVDTAGSAAPTMIDRTEFIQPESELSGE